MSAPSTKTEPSLSTWRTRSQNPPLGGRRRQTLQAKGPTSTDGAGIVLSQSVKRRPRQYRTNLQHQEELVGKHALRS